MSPPDWASLLSVALSDYFGVHILFVRCHYMAVSGEALSALLLKFCCYAMKVAVNGRWGEEKASLFSSPLSI